MEHAKSIVHESPAEQAGYAQLPRVVLFDPDLSQGAKLTYAALKQFAWQGEECWPGQEGLADLLGVGERTLRDYLRELEHRSLVETQRRGFGKTNVYVLKPLTGSELPVRAAESAVLERQPAADKVETEEVESANALRRGRQDHVWDALIVLFGKPTNENEHKRRNRVVKLVKQSLITDGIPEDEAKAEIGRRHKRWQERFSVPATDISFANHWAELGPTPARPPRQAANERPDWLEDENVLPREEALARVKAMQDRIGVDL